MNTVQLQLSRPVWALLMLAGSLGSASALAADKSSPASALATYRQDRALCLSGASNQDRVTCLREAGAAFAQAQRGGLDDGPAPYARNLSQRCERLPDEDRRACTARMQGQGTTTGSVASGGIYRELVTRELVSPSKAEPGSPAPVDAPQ